MIAELIVSADHDGIGEIANGVGLESQGEGLGIARCDGGVDRLGGDGQL